MAKKIAFFTAAAALLLVFLLVQFYRSVQESEWKERSAAVATVTESTYMTVVSRVESFVGEKPIRVAFGEDREGRPAIAWIEDGKAHMEYAANGVSEESVRSKTAARGPNVEILRVLPGKLNGELVWEVFYKRHETDGVRYYYDYYRFKDGSELDTWRLSKKK